MHRRLGRLFGAVGRGAAVRADTGDSDTGDSPVHNFNAEADERRTRFLAFRRERMRREDEAFAIGYRRPDAPMRASDLPELAGDRLAFTRWVRWEGGDTAGDPDRIDYRVVVVMCGEQPIWTGIRDRPGRESTEIVAALRKRYGKRYVSLTDHGDPVDCPGCSTRFVTHRLYEYHLPACRASCRARANEREFARLHGHASQPIGSSTLPQLAGDRLVFEYATIWEGGDPADPGRDDDEYQVIVVMCDHTVAWTGFTPHGDVATALEDALRKRYGSRFGGLVKRDIPFR